MVPWGLGREAEAAAGGFSAASKLLRSAPLFYIYDLQYDSRVREVSERHCQRQGGGGEMTGSYKSWHKMPKEKQEHYELFKIWLGLPYEDPPKERTVREIYQRKTGATANPSSHYFGVRD